MASSHRELDQQFAVLTRICVGRHNAFVRMHNRLLEELEEQWADSPELLKTLEDKKQSEFMFEDMVMLFQQFAQLRNRPDSAEHMEAWYMGEDISNLPPPPEPAPEPQEERKAGKIIEPGGKVTVNVSNDPDTPTEIETDDGPFPEGAQVFGGDYGQEQSSTNGNAGQEASPELESPQADEVLSLQGADDRADAPAVP